MAWQGGNVVLRLISKENFFSALQPKARPWQKNYLAMYSSQWKGYVRDPDLMIIPIDDHLVHRGDGVFDVMRCLGGKIYQLEAHLHRLELSAKAISLELPVEYFEIREIIKTLVRESGEEECNIRVVISRGPGSFSTNPFDCPSSLLMVILVRYHEPPKKYYTEGIPIITSRVPFKQSFFARIKSCNYLPNVLMKMEAIKGGCEYSIGLDDDGFITEGSTESIGIVSKDGILKFPSFDKTLPSVTVKRIFELAMELKAEGIIRDIQFAKIPLSEAYESSEVILLGTSINVVPVVLFDDHRIGDGSPGQVFKRLSQLLWIDMTGNRALLTPL
jgi:branched-chain amino acid aminotransferase